MGNANSLLSAPDSKSMQTIADFVHSMDMVSPENIIQVSLLKPKTRITNIALVTPGDAGHFHYWLLSQINVFMFTYPADALQVPVSHYLKHKFQDLDFITICLEPSLFQAMGLFMENVYSFLTQYEFIEKVVKVQDTLDSLLNEFVGPKMRSRNIPVPEIRCCVPVDPSLFADDDQPYNTSDGVPVEMDDGLSSFAPPVSEPFSCANGETSFAPPVSEPLSMNGETSVAPPVSEPLSCANGETSFAPPLSEPSSMAESSFLPGVSEPSSMAESSFLPGVSEPSSIGGNSGSSSFMAAVSEPRSESETTSSIMLPISEPSSIDKISVIEKENSSLSRSSRSSKKSSTSKASVKSSASRASVKSSTSKASVKSSASKASVKSSASKASVKSSASKTSEFGTVSESSFEDSEIFKSAARTRHEALESSESESEPFSVSSSFASRAGKRRAPTLELSEDDKEFLSEVSGKSVEEAVRDFYRDGETTAKQRRSLRDRQSKQTRRRAPNLELDVVEE